jgi:hypothetical protein
MPTPQENLTTALTLRRSGKYTDAIAAAFKALEQDPTLVPAWECVTSIYMQHRQWKTALELLTRSAEFLPDNIRLGTYHALALMELGTITPANEKIDILLAHAPDDAHVNFAKGEILCAAGEFSAAIPFYTRAGQDEAIKKSSTFALASTHFMIGDYAKAMPGLSVLEDEAPDAPPLPLWMGDTNQHVALYGSQGFGDIIMFLRYVKRAQAGAKKITLRVPYQLAQLVRDSFPDLPIMATKDMIDTNDARLPPGIGFDLPPDATTRCPLIRLSWMLGDFDPAAAPYLRADAEKITTWEKRFSEIPHPRIGLVWAGSPRNAIDAKRSIDFALLQPLTEKMRGHFVSLQMGPQKNQAVGLFDATEFIRDFSDTAAAIAALDLVITVDTAVAHLAGALGKPVWNMMPYLPTDWRWLMHREDTLWYPSMRLFRQKNAGDWSGGIEDICRELKNQSGNNSLRG